MIYVMSDIHGNLRRFNSIMTQIRLQPTDTLYILGDVVDRHPHGIRILRKIMSMSNAKMLLGNHEHMMLRALDQPYDENDRNFPYSTADWLRIWYRNGGKVTHNHLKSIRKPLRKEIFAYLASLPLDLEITVHGKVYKLVHGGPLSGYSPEDASYKNATHYCLWKRWPKDEPTPGDYTMIFGHTPTQYYQDACPMEIYHGDGIIGIDCGSGYPEDPACEESRYGRLACLRLDDGRVFYSE